MAKPNPNKLWRIRLGETEWRRFTYPRTKADPIRLLGSIAKGIMIGALAQDEAGRYFQVVGDHMVELNTRQITKAMSGARYVNGYRPDAPMQAYKPKPIQGTDGAEVGYADDTSKPTVVVVKRRRIAVPA